MAAFIDRHRIVKSATILLAVVVGMAGGFGLQADEIVDRIVAIVNDDIVTYQEVQAEMAPFLKRIQEADYAPEVEQEMTYRLRRDLVNKLVDQKLTDQEIERYDISVSEEEIDNNIEQIKAEKKWTDEDLRRALEEEGLTMEAYRQEMKAQALRTKLVNRAVKSNIVITEADIAAYYEENREAFAGELKYHLHNIIMRLADGAGGGEKEAARQSMQQLRARLIDGRSIESLMQEFRDPDRTIYSSDLGVLAYRDFAPQLKTALDGLSKGDYTTVLETPQGYQIFYVQDLFREDARTLAQAAPEIERILYQSRTEKAFVEWIEELRKGSHIKIIL